MRGIVVSSLVVVLLLQLTFIVSDWNQWANFNGGVHDRPVLRVQPLRKWFFKPPIASVLAGVIIIDDTTGNIVISNSASSQPLFWVLDKNGTVVYSFNDTVTGRCSGALAYENGIVYVLNEETLRVSAVNIISNTLKWTRALSRTGDIGPISVPIIVSDNLLMVPKRDGYMSLNKNTGASASYLRSTNVNGQFMTLTFSYDGLAVLCWSSSELSREISDTVWSVRVSPDPNYNDPKMYPAVIDPWSSEIYATLSVGSMSKYNRSGQKIWTANITVSNYTAIQHGPVLIDLEYLIVMANDSFYAINATTGGYDRVNVDEMTISQVKAQLYYSNNVLYATDGDGNMAAYDVTDRLNWKHLWTVNTGTKFIMGGGPSIASDGTIYVGSSSGDSDAPTLVALVSCPEQQYLSENGTCVSCSTGYFVYFSNNASAGCVLCDDGLVPNANRTACEECPSNTFSMSGDDVCSPCTEQPNNAHCPAPPVTPPTPILEPNSPSTPAIEQPTVATPDFRPATPQIGPVLSAPTASLVSEAVTIIDSMALFVVLVTAAITC